MKQFFTLIFSIALHLCTFGQVTSTFQRYTDTTSYSYNASDIAQINNSSLFVLANTSTYRNLLLKTDLNAHLVWAKSYAPANIQFHQTLPAGNSSAYILGSWYYSGLDYDGIILCKADSSGNILWARKIQQGFKTRGHSFIKSSDGNLLIAGSDSLHTLLMKVDTFGDIVWNTYFYNNQSNNTYSAVNHIPKVSIDELPDQSIIVASTIYDVVGFEFESTPKILLAKTNGNGNLLWSKKIGINSPPGWVSGIAMYYQPSSILYTSDNSLFLSYYRGSYGSFGGASNGLIKLDTTGNIIFSNLPFDQAALIPISEEPLGTINFTKLGGITADVAYPIHPELYQGDLSLTNAQGYRYRSPGAVVSGLHNFIFSNARQLNDNRFAYVGYTYDNGIYKGISILITDSTGNEACTSESTPFYLHTDTFVQVYQNTVLIGSGATSSNISLTNTTISLKNCNCDSIPVADYDFSVSGLTVTFTNQSTNANWFYWNFGDGTYSYDENPTHTYTDSVNHNVNLLVKNNCAGAFKSQTVLPDSLITGVKKYKLSNANLYPNPTTSEFSIDLGFEQARIEIEITNLQGQIIKKEVYNNSQLLDFSIDNPSGIYFITLKTDDETATFKLIKR